MKYCVYYADQFGRGEKIIEASDHRLGGKRSWFLRDAGDDADVFYTQFVRPH